MPDEEVRLHSAQPQDVIWQSIFPRGIQCLPVFETLAFFLHDYLERSGVLAKAKMAAGGGFYVECLRLRVILRPL